MDKLVVLVYQLWLELQIQVVELVAADVIQVVEVEQVQQVVLV